MTGDCAPAWLAALTPQGTLRFLDVAPLLGGGRRAQLLAALRDQVGGYVDRVRVRTRAGWLLVYFHQTGPDAHPLPDNPHARELLLWKMGMDLTDYRGTFLILGERDDRETGLTESQQQLLKDLMAAHPVH